ncbi:hypothetical protein ROZALSC1DRAFT_29360 [Rozella allomycis CSF55]|uniref:Uncharacterized protein n=1 Tax=Rozella allomycis (strain CSF55) TaxID=988480 RepID=A0A4P9YHG4_ROZAC|nr:hypothetical protein ROZALSC1DRAFT_29360 [Rozella allomycis CSF55]
MQRAKTSRRNILVFLEFPNRKMAVDFKKSSWKFEHYNYSTKKLGSSRSYMMENNKYIYLNNSHLGKNQGNESNDAGHDYNLLYSSIQIKSF